MECEEQRKVLGKRLAKNAAVSNVLGIAIISNGKEGNPNNARYVKGKIFRPLEREASPFKSAT